MQNSETGKKTFNICTKCGFHHATPTDKACSAGADEQLEEQIIDDRNLQGEQGPNQAGLDALCDPLDRRNAVENRMKTIEGNMTALDAKLDLILDRFKSTHVKEVENEDVVEEWTRDIEEAWKEVKPRGRPVYKPKKPRARSVSSSSSGSDTEETEGDTKYYERKRFAPKDHKFKRASEIVHICVKTLEKVTSEGGDPVPALKHLKFVSDKVAKGCFNFEAISGYDEAIRARVALEGYSEFAKIETENLGICPVFWLEKNINRYPRVESDMLFSTQNFTHVTYSTFNKS